MHYLQYQRPSTSLLIKAWIAERLENFGNSLSRWLIEDMVSDFDKINLVFSTRLIRINELSVESAKFKLLNLKKSLPYFDKLDKLVSHFDKAEVKNAFNDMKKVVYRYEAKLRQIAYSNDFVIETDMEIKQAISEASKKAISLNL